MKTPLKVRFRFWLCKIFGHKKVYSHHFQEDWYNCKRCGRLVGEEE